MEGKGHEELKGKQSTTTNALKTSNNGNNNANKGKAKEKGYKEKSKLSPEEMERYRKENKCFKYGQQGHVSYAQREEKRMNLLEPLRWRMVILKDLYFLTCGEKWESMML